MADLDPYAAPRTPLLRPAAEASPRPRWAWLRYLPGILLIPPVLANIFLALGAAHALVGQPLNPSPDHRLPVELFPLLAIQVAYSLGMGLVGVVAIRSWCGSRWGRAMLATTAYGLLAATVVVVVWLIAD